MPLIAYLHKQDNRGNRINQWINATATHGKIVQLSHVLNPEAPVGVYELSVETDKATFKEQFQVKQYGKYYTFKSESLIQMDLFRP